MRTKLLSVIATGIACVTSLSFGQNSPISGVCGNNAAQATISGLKSSNYQLGIIPRCTVTVYLTGTIVQPTIYSSSSGGALTNPFTANTDGSWMFFAPLGQGYDVVLSGGVAPNVYPSPVTLVDKAPAQSISIGLGLPAMYSVAAWGDSLTQGNNTNGLVTTSNWPYDLSQMTGVQVYNGGVGGYSSAQILTKFTADTTHKTWYQIIEAGTDDAGETPPYNDTSANIAAMIAQLAPTTPYLVLHLAVNSVSNPVGSTLYTEMQAESAVLASTYGTSFLDDWTPLMANFNPANALDVYDHTNGILPSSNRSIYTGGTLYSPVTFTTACSLSNTINVQNFTPSQAEALIDSEYIFVITVGAQVVGPIIPPATSPSYSYYPITGCTRGYAGSTAATHLANAAYTQWDNIHLSSSGYAFWANLIYQKIVPYFYTLPSVASFEYLGPSTITAALPVIGTPLDDGLGNTAYGIWALHGPPQYPTVTGNSDTAIGYFALLNGNASSGNTAIGNYSMAVVTSGSGNTAVGHESLASTGTGGQNTAVGEYAMFSDNSSSNVAMGNGTLLHHVSGDFNVAVGSNTLANNNTSTRSTAVGYQAMQNSTSSYGTAIGYQALLSDTAGYGTAIGYASMSSNTSGAGNTAVGSYSLHANLTGANNTSIGLNALFSNTGSNNTAVGQNVLYYNTSGAFNVGLGANALSGATASNNTGIGGATLQQTTTGSDNTAVGYLAGEGQIYSYGNTTGSYNTWIGEDAGPGSASVLNDSFGLGYQAWPTASNHGVLGNSSVTDIYAGSESASATVHANAVVTAGLTTTAFTAAGTTFVVTSGCSTSATSGGALAGSFTASSSTCSPVITPGVTAAHGFACAVTDMTTGAATIRETDYNQTTVTFTGANLGSTDQFVFSCVGF
jgi:lysophospholipase L1-like esterase